MFLGVLDDEDEIVERENFAALDLDSDGALSGDEIRQWVLPDHEQVAREEAEHLLGDTDADGDALLSKQEILAQYQLWVGSAATDYGLQLEDRYHDAQEL